MFDNLTPPQKAMIAAALRMPSPGRIYAIKLLRVYTNCSLKDAVAYIDAFSANSITEINSRLVEKWFELERERRKLEAEINIAWTAAEMRARGIIE